MLTGPYCSCTLRRSDLQSTFAKAEAAVDVDALIENLRADVERIRRAIVCLEYLRDEMLGVRTGPVRTRDRRGRKSMGVEERKEVSARMKRYWASRRKHHQS